MSFLPLFLILLCLSVHACNAHLLRILVKEQGHLILEDAGKAKIHKTPIQLRLGHSVLKAIQTQAQQETRKDERKINMNLHDEDNMKQEEYLKALLKEAAASMGATSVDIIVPSPHIPSPHYLQRLARKDVNSQTRSLLESSPNENTEAVDSKKDDVVDDTVVMDYAQPHRKPPIHNEKP